MLRARRIGPMSAALRSVAGLFLSGNSTYRPLSRSGNTAETSGKRTGCAQTAGFTSTVGEGNRLPEQLPESRQKHAQGALALETDPALCGLQPLEDRRIRRHMLSKPNERACHEDAHLHCALAAQDVRCHQRAMFGKRPREATCPSVLLGCGHRL
jgi:hypothetical protein